MATLKPPSAQYRSSSSHTPTGPPKAPLKADPSATIADTVVFQGTYPVTIGAGTIIHPRARFYAYEGPISIGDGCVISEKAVIGASPSSSVSSRASPSSSTGPSPSSSSTDLTRPTGQEIATRISYFVIIGPQSTVLPGAHIHSSAEIEALTTIHRNAEIGSHSKICSGCEVPAGGAVADWTVVWGNGVGQRRKRARDARIPGPAVLVAAQVAQTPMPSPAPAGKVIEDARLMALQKEREVLARMLVPSGPARKK